LYRSRVGKGKEPPLSHGISRSSSRRIALLLLALAPAACAAPQGPPAPAPPANPFLGAWATSGKSSVVFEPGTIVEAQANGQQTPLDAGTCGGRFHFAYGTKDRRALVALIPQQPNLQERLSHLLPAPSYPVAQLVCDRGDQTYVLLGRDDLLAIYRDGEIAVLDRLRRH
jgi:hypothetical protein